MDKRIGKITDTFLGIEDHGMLTAVLTVDYGGVVQGIGGYVLDKYTGNDRCGTAYGMEVVARILRACGVSSWEKVKGRTIFVLEEDRKVIGIENLPTENGTTFIFADLYKEMYPDVL